MDAVAKSKRNPVSKHQIPPECVENGRADAGRAEPVERKQILRREQERGKNMFSCSAGHEQDSQLYTADLYSEKNADHTLGLLAL